MIAGGARTRETPTASHPGTGGREGGSGARILRGVGGAYPNIQLTTMIGRIDATVPEKKTDRQKTKELLDTLALHWPAPSCAFIPEFRGGTGWSVEERADAIAMHLWPSMGLDLVGYELKVSRSDWLRELKQPNKATPIKRFCDFWYLVVYDLKVVKYADELPNDWGLKFMENGKIITMIEAPKLKAEPIDRLFLASLMRRATKQPYT